MMESTTTVTDQQTTPALPINNSSSRRKQSKPNRLEHVIVESSSTCDTLNPSGVLPSLTQYHVAAEQQESAIGDDDSDRASLNCEDGSLSSHSTGGEHYAMEDILNRSRRHLHQQQTHSNEKTNFNENLSKISIEENEQDEQIDSDNQGTNVLDFSMKLDEFNKQSANRSRSLNPMNKPRSLKRKHQNGLTDNNNGIKTRPSGIFHADAFCGICRKEFCNKYFLKTHLANKHGILDQSAIPSVSTLNLSSLQNHTDITNDDNLQHPFTVISTLLQNGHEDYSSSPNSPSSDLLVNQQNLDDGDDNETELSSLRHEMNGVIAGDDDNQHDDNEQDDDEQDGTHINSLRNLPHKIATILCNDNTDRNSMLNDNDDDENNQRDLTTNSPTNSLDYQQQQASSSTTTTSQTSILPSTSTASLSRQSSGKSAEDFCDICQKHFCNKYYLRKHRLDVHGVQTDSNIKPYKRIDSNSLLTKNSPPSTSQISSSIQLPSSFPNVAFNPASVQQSLGMLLNPIFSPLVQSQTNSEQSLLSSNKRRHTDNSNESSSSTLSLTKPQFPPSLLTAASDVASVFANQLTSTTANSSKSQISTCHLCGKKFQNNEYLKLHLTNKHQIIATDKDLDSQQRAKLSSLIKSSSNGSLTNNSTVKKIKLETTETPSITTTNVIKAASPLDVITSANSSAVIPGIVDTYFAAKMADRVSCDICHKQVCNKYFLKTHKLKVHGVGPDPANTSSSSNPLNNSELNDDTIDQEQHSRSSSFDGSPPQLVVDELNSINAEPGVIPSPDELTASVNTCISTNNTSASNDSIEQVATTKCELCSKAFPTKFFHVHMNNAHGIQQAPIIMTNGTNNAKRPLTNGNNNNNTAATTTTTTTNVRLKQTPQVQLRVTCQVCKKELCNKYFLRAHMRNVHNISVDDLHLIQQKSPSQDQQNSQNALSLSSNILSLTSTDNDINGHTTDSNDSENLHNYSSSTSLITTTTANLTGTNDNNNNNNHLLSMQPFLVESDDDLYKDLFVPCMVYLPCRHRVTKPLEVSLRLKPVDNTSSTTNAATVSTAD